MKIKLLLCILALASVAALSSNGNAQTVDPTKPGLKLKGEQKTETGVDLKDGVCRVTFFGMDGLGQSLRVEVSCWKDNDTYTKWTQREANSLPIKKVEFSASNGDYAAILGANADLFANFIGKVETVLLQNPKLAEVLETNRTP